MGSLQRYTLKTALVLALVAMVGFGCVAPETRPAVLDPVDQQVVVSDLTAECYQGDQKACKRLPVEKERLIRILAK